jgi:hypothetical protein
MRYSPLCFHAEAFSVAKQPMLLKSFFTGSSTFLAMDRFRMMPDEVSKQQPLQFRVNLTERRF